MAAQPASLGATFEGCEPDIRLSLDGAPTGRTPEWQPWDMQTGGQTDSGYAAAEEKSLDLVQRVVISAILCVVFGAPTVALTAYAPYRALTSPADATGLWVMGLVLGIVAAEAVLLINRRRPWHPAVLLGLVPAAISAYGMWLR